MTTIHPRRLGYFLAASMLGWAGGVFIQTTRWRQVMPRYGGAARAGAF